MKRKSDYIQRFNKDLIFLIRCLIKRASSEPSFLPTPPKRESKNMTKPSRNSINSTIFPNLTNGFKKTESLFGFVSKVCKKVVRNNDCILERLVNFKVLKIDKETDSVETRDAINLAK